MVWILIAIVGAVADQLLKAYLSGILDPAKARPVIDGFFYLALRTNTGAAWSFLADSDAGRILLATVSVVASLVMIVAILTYPDRRIRACLAFLCAGSMGNLVDRLRFGGVTDYLDFHFGTYVFPTFNLADTLIVCSSIALGIVVLFAKDLPTWRWPARRKDGASEGGKG